MILSKRTRSFHVFLELLRFGRIDRSRNFNIRLKRQCQPLYRMEPSHAAAAARTSSRKVTELLLLVAFLKNFLPGFGIGQSLAC